MTSNCKQTEQFKKNMFFSSLKAISEIMSLKQTSLVGAWGEYSYQKQMITNNVESRYKL